MEQSESRKNPSSQGTLEYKQVLGAYLGSKAPSFSSLAFWALNSPQTPNWQPTSLPSCDGWRYMVQREGVLLLALVELRE